MISHLGLSRRLAGSLLVTGTLVSAATLPAQSVATDARWQAWLGCWRTTNAPATPSEIPGSVVTRGLELLGVPTPTVQVPQANEPPTVCIVPAGGRSAVEVISVADGKVVSRERVDASGERQAINRDGCSGWQQATWSKDGERVFLKSEISCGPGLTRTTSGVLAMSATGEWLDIQGLQAGGNNGVRVAHYRDAGTPATLPAEISQLGLGSQLANRTARIAAGAPVNPSDVIEATKTVNASVVQSWIAELGQHFQLDANTLVQLADAGVPGAVTDMMVAISYPKEFIVRQPAGAPADELLRTGRDSARVASEYLRSRGCSSLDAFAFSPYGWGYDPYYASSMACSRYGFSPYSSFYSPYRYEYGYGYGYGYGSPYYSGYVTSGPVIVVRGEETPHGRVVNGRGYSRPSSGSSTGTSSTSTRGTASDGTAAGSASSSGTSSGSAGTSSSGGSSSSGRTAIPRPPQ